MLEYRSLFQHCDLLPSSFVPHAQYSNRGKCDIPFCFTSHHSTIYFRTLTNRDINTALSLPCRDVQLLQTQKGKRKKKQNKARTETWTEVFGLMIFTFFFPYKSTYHVSQNIQTSLVLNSVNFELLNAYIHVFIMWTDCHCLVTNFLSFFRASHQQLNICDVCSFL